MLFVVPGLTFLKKEMVNNFKTSQQHTKLVEQRSTSKITSVESQAFLVSNAKPSTEACPALILLHHPLVMNLTPAHRPFTEDSLGDSQNEDGKSKLPTRLSSKTKNLTRKKVGGIDAIV